MPRRADDKTAVVPGPPMESAPFVKAGYLYKFKYWRQQWERRYFVLTRTTMYYFRRKPDAELFGELRFQIPLDCCSVSLGANDLTFRIKLEGPDFGGRAELPPSPGHSRSDSAQEAVTMQPASSFASSSLAASASSSSPPSTSSTSSSSTPPAGLPLLPPSAASAASHPEDEQHRSKKAPPKNGSLRMGVSMMRLGHRRSVLCRADNAEELRDWLRALRGVQEALEARSREELRRRMLSGNLLLFEDEPSAAEYCASGGEQPEPDHSEEDSASEPYSDPDSEDEPASAEGLSRCKPSPIAPAAAVGSASARPLLPPKPQKRSLFRRKPKTPVAAAAAVVAVPPPLDFEGSQAAPAGSGGSSLELRTAVDQPALVMLTIGSQVADSGPMAERIAVRSPAWRQWIPVLLHAGDMQLVASFGDNSEVRISVPRLMASADDDFFPVLANSPPPSVQLPRVGAQQQPAGLVAPVSPEQADRMICYSLPVLPVLGLRDFPAGDVSSSSAEDAADNNGPDHRSNDSPPGLPQSQQQQQQGSGAGFRRLVCGNPLTLRLQPDPAAPPETSGGSAYEPQKPGTRLQTPSGNFNRVCRVSWRPFPGNYGPLPVEASGPRQQPPLAAPIPEKKTKRKSQMPGAQRLVLILQLLVVMLLVVQLAVLPQDASNAHLLSIIGAVAGLASLLLSGARALAARDSGLAAPGAGKLVDPVLQAAATWEAVPTAQPSRPTLWMVRFHYLCYRHEMDEYLDRRQARSRARLLKQLEREDRKARRDERKQQRHPGLPASSPIASMQPMDAAEIERIRESLVVRDSRVEPWGKWSPADPSPLKLRGPTYLSDKVKVPAQDWSFDLTHTAIVPASRKIQNIIAPGQSEFVDAWRSRFPPGQAPLLLVITFQVNLSSPQFSLQLFYSQRPSLAASAAAPAAVQQQQQQHMQLRMQEAGERLLNDFLKSFGDDPDGAQALQADRGSVEDQAFRRSSLKFIPRVVNGGFIVRKVVGGKPALIGNKLTMSSYWDQSDRLLELDIDVASSVVARKIWSAVKSLVGGLSMDICWTLEGNCAEHLPERLLGGVRIEDVNIPWMEQEMLRNDAKFAFEQQQQQLALRSNE